MQIKNFWEKFLKKLEENIVSIFGLFLAFFILGKIIFQKGFVFFTDFVHGPNVKYIFSANNIFINSELYLFDFISPEFSSKIIFFTTILLLYFAGSFFAKNFTDNKYLQIFAGSFAVLNLFVYERILYGQIGVTLSLAFYIFFLSFLVKSSNQSLEKQKSFYVLSSGIFAGLALDSSLHSIFFILFTLFVFFIFNNNFKENFIKSISIIIIAILVNSYFFINIFLGKNETLNFVNSKISASDFLAFQTVGSNIFHKIFNLLFLTGFWGREQMRFLDITDNPIWFLGFLPFAFLIIFGIYKMYKQNKKFFNISISFIIFVPILATATSINFLSFLYKFIPFYSGLREPQKWAMILVPIYILAIIFAVKNIKNISEKSLSIILILLLIIFQNKFLFAFSSQMHAANFPESLQKVNEVINKEESKCESKNLFLPWHLYLSFPFTKNVVANPANYFFTCKFVTGTNMEFGGIFDNNLNKESNEYGYWLFENNENLPPENTKFIVVAKTLDWERYNWLAEKIYLQKIFEDENIILYKVITN